MWICPECQTPWGPSREECPLHRVPLVDVLPPALASIGLRQWNVIGKGTFGEVFDVVHVGRVDADARADIAFVDGGDAVVSREITACGRTITIRGIACDSDSTHIDCFGGGGCEGGVAWRNLYAPIPVPNVCNIETDLTHICCIEQVSCALGCASDWRDRIGPGPDPFDPRLLCEETAWCADGGDAACDASPE